MNVFVTGGTGLVGSHTIRLLCNRGCTVRALVRDASGQEFIESIGATPVTGTVEDAETWALAAGTDAIVHAAAIVANRRAWSTYRTFNIEGARNAAINAAKLGIQLVHISSVSVYGRGVGATNKRIDEHTAFAELSPTDFYARSKREAEATINDVVRNTGLSTVSLRPCVIYGERDRTFLPHVVRVLSRGFAPLVGNGSNSLAVVYAGNVAEAVLAALEHQDVTGPVNIANDGVVTQREFYAAVGSALEKRIRLLRVPVPAAYVFAAARHLVRRMLSPNVYPGFGASAVNFLAYDNPYTSTRALRELGWQPSTPPQQAIAQSIRWFLHDHGERASAATAG
jgi:nucleoside-diphosphate-sugar epimerase